MTCIAAIKKDNIVWIGGDSAGATPSTTTPRSDPKVFKNGDYVFGFTTSFRMGNLLQHSFNPPRLPVDEIPTHKFMVTEFVDAVRKCLKDGGFAHKENEVERGGTFLVGVKDQLFEIDSDYQVGMSLNDYLAVGSGMEYALGSLHSNYNTIMSPEEIITRALEASAHFNPFVRPPYTILNTEEE